MKANENNIIDNFTEDEIKLLSDLGYSYSGQDYMRVYIESLNNDQYIYVPRKECGNLASVIKHIIKTEIEFAKVKGRAELQHEFKDLLGLNEND